MTTWREALMLFRAERDEAIKFKEMRDDIVWSLKMPCNVNTGHGTEQFYEEIMFFLTVVKTTIFHNRKNSECDI